MKATTDEKLPRWDMSNIYSSLEGRDYHDAVARLEKLLGEMESLFDKHGVRRLSQPPAEGDDSVAALLESVLRYVNELDLVSGTLESYVHAFLTTNSYDTLAQRETSRLEMLDIRATKLSVRLQMWIGGLAPRLERWIADRAGLAEHAYFLRRTARQSRFLMPEEMEALAAELCIDGPVAFGKLQGNVTSQLKVPFRRDGKDELLPITVVHNLSSDADAAIRERAHHAEIKGWESIRTTVAACLNSVKGSALVLARRRGRKSVLEVTLDDNHIDRGTLDALLGSIQDALPVFRRYLKAKARKLGLKQLRWWDLFAPLGGGGRKFGWPEACDFVAAHFAGFSDDLADFARGAFAGRWVDAEPRDGKRGGAYCMEVLGVEQSRIMMNFDGSFDQVSTLAHELGHGYHNHCQRGLPPLRRGAPMALAETASIFCETLVAEAALAAAAPKERQAILEFQLLSATQVCLDISSRFQFESAVFEQRGENELSADDFCALMLAAQRATYADAVDEATYHPYMWLWKPHYYSFEENFYNFPYAFGHLFGLGLYAIFQREGKTFVPRYRELLRSTAQDDAAPLAARFGIDITRRDFWQGSLNLIARQVDQFEKS